MSNTIVKDFWDEIERLEELAGKLKDEEWFPDYPQGDELEYIAAANPAMIKEMIAELRWLNNKVNDKNAQIRDKVERIKVLDQDLSRLRAVYRTMEINYSDIKNEYRKLQGAVGRLGLFIHNLSKLISQAGEVQGTIEQEADKAGCYVVIQYGTRDE